MAGYGQDSRRCAQAGFRQYRSQADILGRDVRYSPQNWTSGSRVATSALGQTQRSAELHLTFHSKFAPVEADAFPEQGQQSIGAVTSVLLRVRLVSERKSRDR
jgi:hypothetical protein